MVRISKFGPKGVTTTIPSRSREAKSRSTNGTCVFYQDRNNYVIFRLKGRAQGFAGNRWQVLLLRNSSDRFSIRIKDATGTILTTITNSGGMAALMTEVNSDAILSPIVRMQIVGTIGADTEFSSDIDDYFRFTGGS